MPTCAQLQPSEDLATPLSIALSAFDIGAQITLIGVLACRWVVLSRGGNPDAERSTRHLLGGAVALVTAASFGILLSRTLELNGGKWHGLFADMRLALTVTHFGHVWRWRIPALVLLWLVWACCSRRPRHAWTGGGLMLIAVAGIALTRSQTGHPGDHGDFMLPVWVDWGHLLAAGAWVGSLFGVSLAVFPDLLRAGEHAVTSTAALFQRLSTLSGVALTVLIACGIYNAVQQLGNVSALWTSRYGIILDIKLLIVLTMIALGAHNRYVKLPRLLRCSGQPVPASWFGNVFHRLGGRDDVTPTGAEVIRQCARAVLIESLLGLAVIVTTSILLHAMPPTDMPQHGLDARMGVQAELAPDLGKDYLSRVAEVQHAADGIAGSEGR